MKQGEKLLLLVKRDPRSSEKIAEEMGVDKSYLPKLYKLEKLPPKPLKKALAVFGVTQAYFLDNAESPSLVSEPSAAYPTEPVQNAEWNRLQKELALLRDENSRLLQLLEQEKNINAALSEAILNMSKR